MAWQVLAAVAYAVLLESAIETFVRGSPVRWWVAAIAALYAGITAACWRRTSWSARAASSSLVLIGMLALTAWLPGGLENGVRLLGLSTSTLLSVAVATGVTVGAFVLGRSARLPRGFRVAITVLAAYAVIAFLYGAAAGVPFASFFSGHSFWRALPFLLQGAAVGGLIVVPAALVAVAIRVGTRHPNQGSPQHTLYQVVALATTFAIAVAALPRGTGLQMLSQSNAVADSARRMAILDNSLRAIEDGDRESPRDRWDPDYIVEGVGRDPGALFAWVRDNTFWIPYRGILRAATGVLMDRQGNSLDRAILLATLFERSGHKARLAYRELDAVADLSGASAGFDVRQMLPEELAPVTLAEVRETAKRYRLDPDAVARTIETHNQAAVHIANALDARVADQTTRLLKLVVRPNPRTEWVQRLENAATARREHWWVQLEAAGEWTDFDLDDRNPTRPSGLSAQRTLSLKELTEPGLHHEIVVRVIAEQWSKGTVAERTALEQTLRPSELIGEPVVVQFLPASVLGDSPPTKAPIDTAVDEQSTWVASLSVGSEAVASGILNRRVTGGGGPFSGLGGAISRMAATDEGELSAVWLEYEFRTPGESSQTIRRVVFDLIGPAARAASSVMKWALTSARQLERSLALSQRTELLPVACRFSPDFVRHLVAQNLTRNRALLRVAVQNFNSFPDDSLQGTLDAAIPPVTSLYSLALARLEWGADEPFVYIDRAGLLTAHTGFVREAGETLVRAATDIVRNPIGVTLAVWDAFALRLAHGVLDTNLEAFLHSGTSPGENTADAFSAPSDSWLALSPGQGDLVAQLRLSDDVQQRIRDDLAAGSIVVAPRAPVTLSGRPFSGWWRIDSRTGHALGMGASGWGQNEYATIQMRNLAAKEMLKKAGLRAFWVFNTTAGFCLVQETVTNVEKKGLWPGLRAVVVENPNQCAYQGLFFGAVAALPLVILTVNIRLSSVAPGAGSVVSETTAASQSAGAESDAAAAESSAGKKAPPVNPLAETADGSGNNPFAKTEAASPSAAPQGQPSRGSGSGAPANRFQQPFKPGEAPPGEGPYQGDPELREWLKDNADHPLSEMIGGRASHAPEGTEGLYRQADAASRSAYNTARNAGQSAQAARQASWEAYWNYLKQGRGDYMQRLPSGGWLQKRGPGTIKIEAGSAGVAGSGGGS